MAQKFSPEFKQRALGLLAEHRRLDEDEESVWTSCQRVATSLGGISPHTLYGWAKHQRIDTGQEAGFTSSEREELLRLRKENRELGRANEILKAASAFFAAEPGRPGPR